MQWHLQNSKEWYKGLSALDIWDTPAKVEHSHVKTSIFSSHISKYSSSIIKRQHMVT